MVQELEKETPEMDRPVHCNVRYHDDKHDLVTSVLDRSLMHLYGLGVLASSFVKSDRWAWREKLGDRRMGPAGRLREESR
jgi:hypothetical protein